MINWSTSWWGLAVGVLLTGCVAHAPSSLRPGRYDPASAWELWPAAYTTALSPVTSVSPAGGTTEAISIENQLIPNPAPYPDDEVLRFKSGLKLCRDTFQLPDLRKNIPAELLGLPEAPDMITINADGLGIDEAEITNLSWRLYEALSVEGGAARTEVVPDSAALPMPDYYTNPFYAYYPVVGISYEQAVRYCAWRSQIVTQALVRSNDAKSNTLVCEYRLPTEAEWELAALVASGLPYGSSCTQLPVCVAPGAAAYLQKRAGTQVPVAQVKRDIAAYNQRKPIRSWINYAQPEPYFLRLATPGYVYQAPANEWGLYHMLGNAAEMVAERGLTKGGSYRDGIPDCQVTARGHFDGPAPTVGFRCVGWVRRVAP